MERAEQIVTHEILQGDAFNEADVSLEMHTSKKKTKLTQFPHRDQSDCDYDSEKKATFISK